MSMEGSDAFSITSIRSETLPVFLIETTDNCKGGLTDAEWSLYKAELKKIYNESESTDCRCSLLFSITMDHLKIEDITRMGTIMTSLRHRTKSAVLATGLIVNNPVVKTLLVGILESTYKFVRPHKFVSTLDEGLEFFRAEALHRETLFVKALCILLYFMDTRLNHHR